MKKLNIIIVILFAFVLTGCSTPKNIEVSKDFPTEVKEGDEFDITVTIKNTKDKKQTFKGFDIGTEYIDGIMILNTKPKANEEDTLFGLHSFYMNEEIEANSEIQVKIKAKAVKTGDFSGDFDVCIKSDSPCLYGSIRTIVK
ncbi:MAG: lipoprotein [Candidatus Moranbacteria bacterium]|nr:lipoprotein [Candidatus Moranbacteria bacterium]